MQDPSQQDNPVTRQTSQPIDLEKVRNYLISRRQAQSDQINKSHGVWALSELPPDQEVLFKSPADDEYIHGTIIEKAPLPWSYIIEAQGRKYHRTREHVWPIHLNLPPIQQQQDLHRQQCFPGPSTQSHKQQCFTGPSQQPHTLQAFSGPSLPKSCIPRSTKGNLSLSRPSVLARLQHPQHLAKLLLYIPHPLSVNKIATVHPSEEDLLLHLSSLTPLHSAGAKGKETQMPAELCPALTPPAVPKEKLEAESPSSPDSQASIASYSLCPGCLSHTTRQPSADYKGDHRLRSATTLSIPFPSNSECSTGDTDGNQSSDDSDDTDGSPAEVEANSSCQQIESLTAGTGTDMPTPQDAQSTKNKVSEDQDLARKMPLQQQRSSP